MEVWKDIENYNGIYQVSDLGRVRSLNRKDTLGRKWQGKILAPKTKHNGYKSVNLNKDGKQKTFLVHRLVALSFIENPGHLPEINHIDENKDNNSVDNLEWVSHIQNINYGTGHARSVRNRNYENISKKMDYKKLADAARDVLSKKVIAIDENGKRYEYSSLTEASKELGLWRQNIGKCCMGKVKTTGGYKFEYK